MYVVRKKLKITAALALTGSIMVILGHYFRNPILILGLLLVALSPIISFIIVYFQYKRGKFKAEILY